MGPHKLINTSNKPVILRRNANLADVYTVVALEDMDVAECSEVPLASCIQSAVSPSADANSAKDKLRSVGLSGVHIESCEVSEDCKRNLADLVLQYEDVFSPHHLDWGDEGLCTPKTPVRQQTIQAPIQASAPWPVPEAAPSAE